MQSKKAGRGNYGYVQDGSVGIIPSLRWERGQPFRKWHHLQQFGQLNVQHVARVALFNLLSQHMWLGHKFPSWKKQLRELGFTIFDSGLIQTNKCGGKNVCFFNMALALGNQVVAVQFTIPDPTHVSSLFQELVDCILHRKSHHMQCQYCIVTSLSQWLLTSLVSVICQVDKSWLFLSWKKSWDFINGLAQM